MFRIWVLFNFSVFQKCLVNTVTICMVYGKGSHKSNQRDATCFTKFCMKLPKVFYLAVCSVFFYMQDTHANKEKLKVTDVLWFFLKDVHRTLQCFKYKFSPLETNGIALIIEFIACSIRLVLIFCLFEVVTKWGLVDIIIYTFIEMTYTQL